MTSARGVLRRYAIACAFVALAAALKFVLDPVLGYESPFLIFFAAVMASALAGGIGPGLLASAAAAAISAYFFFPPYFSFEIAEPRVQLRLAVFLLEGVVVAVVSAALRSAKHRADEERRAAEALGSVGALMSRSLDPAEVQRQMVEAVRGLFNARNAILFTIEDESGDFVACAHSVAPGREFVGRSRFLRGTGVVALAFRERRPVISVDVLADARVELTEEVRAHIAAEGSQAVLAVPLVAGDSVSGALAIVDRRGRQFSRDEVRVAEIFANQAAIALEKAQLYAAQQLRAARLRTLADLDQIISSSLDTGEVLPRIARAAGDLTAAPLVEFWIANHTTRTLELRVFSDPAVGADKRLTTLDFGQGGVGWVAEHRAPLVVPDVFADSRILAPEWFKTHQFMSGLWLPIVAGDQLLGVLSILGRKPFQLGADDREVLDTFVAQAAIALRNAQLHEELRATHARLTQSQAQIVQTERLRALGEMAAGVAHDFNNLLAVIVGRADLLLRRVNDPAVRRGLESIHRAGLDGSHTVQRIQEFTRTRTTQAFELVDVRRLLVELVDFTRPRWKDEPQQRGIYYDVRVADGEVPRVAGQPAELREVFLNLLTNALEAMPDGGTCVFTPAVSGDDVLVHVQDTGNGIAPDSQPRIFEPFFTTKGPQSSGLGLAVSWGIITRHGGRIDVDSRPAGGTTMTVRLPIGTSFVADTSSESPPPARAGARILVIEDEDAVREVLVDTLKSAGYDVIAASNGREALARCDTVDLVMTDLSMPGMSGWEVADAWYTRLPHVPIGVVTGWGDQLEAEKLARHHVQFVVAKPFQSQEVLARVGKALTSPIRP